VTTLDTPLVDLIGDRTSKLLHKVFGMEVAADLLRHYPRRLAERGELTDLASLEVDDDVTVVAEVVSRAEKGYGKSMRVEVIISDGSGRLQLVFFGNRSVYRTRNLEAGVRGLFSGKVGLFNRTRQLSHPDYVLLKDGSDVDPDSYAGALIPVYPASKDLPTWTIANSVAQLLRMLDEVPEPMPAELRGRQRLMSFDSALRSMHQPASREEWYRARQRLAWDEAFGLQLVLAQRRAAASLNPAIARPARSDRLRAAFDAQLPFTLTVGQSEIGAVIAGELAQAHPMHRLLQGEVGSGKTVVALRAMLQVVDAGGQAALLAPTEVLAAQHARTIEAMLGPLARAGQLGGAEEATRVALLTGSLPAAARKAALLDAASGAAGIVVGTHALIQEHVQFAELGLVVVDEQHRFGVEQRDALRSKAAAPPHLLVMTATPIPRTVAMTVFGDLETSTLAELPAGRAPILTSVVPVAERPAWLERVWQRIREEVAAGHQAYVVCPRIGLDAAGPDMEADGSEQPPPEDARRPPLAVADILPMLACGPLAGLAIAALHGKLSSDDKDRTMTEFTAGRIDVLVATTVVEVGVDVPNATVMAILDADRFGVSQLHQLRGRIGRGQNQGICLLVTDLPEASPSRERLDAVASTNDGFELARLDVEQRREGDILGAAQSGRRSQLKLLSLLRDEALIEQARTEATTLIAADPDLVNHPRLSAQVSRLLASDNAEYLDKS
jgi:ATP-dependent DNA helicase RecG